MALTISIPCAAALPFLRQFIQVDFGPSHGGAKDIGARHGAMLRRADALTRGS
jgi:hypothetical protein